MSFFGGEHFLCSTDATKGASGLAPALLKAEVGWMGASCLGGDLAEAQSSSGLICKMRPGYLGSLTHLNKRPDHMLQQLWFSSVNANGAICRSEEAARK